MIYQALCLADDGPHTMAVHTNEHEALFFRRYDEPIPAQCFYVLPALSMLYSQFLRRVCSSSAFVLLMARVHSSNFALSHIVNHNPDSQNIIVGVRIKRPVLVPRHWCTATLRFEIEFTVLESNIRAKERAQDVGDLGISN